MKYLKQTATFWGLVALDSYFTFFGISLLEYLSNLFGIFLESMHVSMKILLPKMRGPRC